MFAIGLGAVSSTATGDAGLMPLVLMLSLGALTVLLVRNMRTRLRNLPRTFPADAEKIPSTSEAPALD